METRKDGQRAKWRCESCGESLAVAAKGCKNCGWTPSGKKLARGLALGRAGEGSNFEGADLAPAALLLRVVAGFVDWTIVVVLGFGIYLALFIGFSVIASGGHSHIGPEGLAITAMGLAVILVPWLYFAVLESSTLQGPIGKALLGLRVTDMGGEQVSFGRASRRYLAKIGTLGSCCIGLAPAAFTQKRQAIHDILTGTLVQR